MSTRVVLSIALCSSLAATACAKPTLTRRYQTLTPPESVAQSAPGPVELTASVFPVEPPAPRTIFDLGTDGQAALITALAAQGGGSLPGALASPIVRGQTGVVDRTTVNRRVVLSVSTTHAGLADRLDYASIVLELPKNAPARFSAWNQLATKFETVDVGKLTFSQKDSLSSGLEGILPGISEITKATAGATRERIMGEEVLLRQRYVAITGSLVPTTAKVVQQGAVGIDLVGNTVFDVTLAGDRIQQERLYSVEGLFKSGQPSLPADVTLNRRLIRFVETASDWTVAVNAQFRRRRVTDGDRTVTESDDAIAYENVVSDGGSLTLVGAEDLKVSKWLIYNPQCEPIHVEEHAGPVVLQFDSFEGAENMLRWMLQTNTDTVAGRRLGYAKGINLVTPTATPRWLGLRVEINGLNWLIPPGSCAR